LEPSLFRYVWKHSRRDQLLVLAIILLSLPFYFASFDLPKRIINDALQGKAFAPGSKPVHFLKMEFSLPILGDVHVFGGFQVNQLQLLMGLSFLFLLFVFINGAFKYYINLKKGILGERMLRRMRFELFSLYLRFRPEDIRVVKPAEAASIIKDEVDPIGGFTGDAFIQPAFLIMQASTALLFIMVQSFWLGLVALAIVMVQGFVIPRLRREQLRLTRLRQIESRKLAGRIGEVIETSPAIHGGGATQYIKADLGGRLGTLFKIRVDLFRRKFAVKYLNNLLAQITPFFFYSIGGYLALTGAMNIGQLVAVIAAYRDLPPPVKELIDWDQDRADVTVKYQQIVAQFPTQLMNEESANDAGKVPAPDAPITIDALKVLDRRGVTLLEPMSATIMRPGHVALVGGSGSGRDVLARLLGRQVSEFRGKVKTGGVSWRSMSDHVASRFMAYAGPDPLLSSGTLRDNVIAPLMRNPPRVFAETAEAADPSEVTRRIEAMRSGNPVALASHAWLDAGAAGLADVASVDGAIMALLDRVGMADDVYRFGLLGKLDEKTEPDIVSRIPAAREVIFQNLRKRSLLNAVEPLDPARYNRNATISENLLFGLPTGERFSDDAIGSDPYVRSILETEALVYPLAQIGLRMAEAVIEIFADLPPGHPLFERFSFIRSDEMPEFIRLVETVEARGSVSRLSADEQSRLIGLAMSYVEPRHRMEVMTPLFERRILRARKSLKAYLPGSYAADVEFYDPARYLCAAPVLDNLLFGRITYGVANAEQKVYEVIKDSLRDLGMEAAIHRLGLGYEIGPAGRLLSSQQRAAIALVRALVTRPDMLVLDGALSVFGHSEAAGILAALHAEMAGKTLITTLCTAEDASGFDEVLEFEGARLVSHIKGGNPLHGKDDTPVILSQDNAPAARVPASGIASRRPAATAVPAAGEN
jgi:putative ABC transport system ATP-binding protein